jgi:ABC-2 type transport system ATP-binding protein
MAHGRIISQGSVDALRARVALKRVRCSSRLDVASVAAWPEVVEARMDGDRLWMSTAHAEALLRRLLAADDQLDALEVQAAGLAEAFTELTDAADSAAASQREAA